MIVTRKKGGNIPAYSKDGIAMYPDAVIQSTGVVLDTVGKHLEVTFGIYPDSESIDTVMILDEFKFEFDEDSEVATIYSDDANTVVAKWGYPSYDTVFYYIKVTNDGIVTTSPTAALWLLEVMQVAESDGVTYKASTYWENN